MHRKRGRHHEMWQLLTGFLFVLAGVACTSFLERHNLLAWPQRALLDSLPTTLTSTPTNDVVIIAIDDDDYAERFQRRSPLDPIQVAKLIEAIQFFGPQLIGVDLDTEDWEPRDAARVQQKPGRLIWARLFTADESGPLRIAQLNKVLGSDGAGVCYGLTAMQADSDLRVRQYPTEYRQKRGSEEVAYPSFPVVVLHLVTDGSCPKEGKPQSPFERTEENWDENRLLIRYRGERQGIRQITAGALMDTRELARQNPENAAVRQMIKLIDRRIVLLGGTYAAGRDRYPTPVGQVAGVDILGHAILSASQPAIREPGRGLLWFDVCLGLSLVLLSLRHPKLATAVNLTLLVLLIPISGWLFRSYAFFLDAIPVQLSVLLHSTMHPALEKHLERLEEKVMK